MKPSLLILISGVGLAALAFAGVYFAGTADCCRLEDSQQPEFAWLKTEFHLGDAEFKRVSEMHQQYVTGCQERCRRIYEKNRELAHLLGTANGITADIESLLLETARMRAECQKEMLKHFYEVSRSMPPEQGRRYLTWVQEHTILVDTHATMHH